MTLQEVETRKGKVEKRMSEIQEELAKEPTVETEEEIANEEVKTEELEKEVAELTEERKGLIETEKSLKDEAEKRQKQLDEIAKGVPTEKIVEERKEEKKMEQNVIETKEYRSAFLKKLMGKELNEEEQRAMTTATASVGSVIPTTTLNRIEELLRQTSALYPHISILNVAGYLSIPTEKTTNDASWVAEGSASSDSADALSEVSFAAYKLIKTVSITAEVSAMSIDAFESYIVKKLSDKMAIAIENAILNGTGTAQPKGILAETYDATNSKSYSTMAYTDITGIIALLKSGYKVNAKFAVNSKTLWNVIANIVDENKRPIFIANVEGGFAGRILGIPVIEDELMPDDKVLLGDFSKYTINFNSPIQLATDTSVEFRKGDKVYRAMALLDGKVVNTEAFVLLSKTVESV